MIPNVLIDHSTAQFVFLQRGIYPQIVQILQIILFISICVNLCNLWTISRIQKNVHKTAI